MTAEALYAQLRELADSEPNFTEATPELSRWLGRLHDAVDQAGVHSDRIALTVASDNLGGLLADTNARTIRNILYRALARVERGLPATAQGGFIAAGDVFQAIAVMGTTLESTRTRVLFVDPYMGPEVLTKYALMAPEGVQIDLLAASGRAKAALTPVAKEWVEQYGSKRPLRLRLADPSTLHDRLLFIDDADVWDISQSLNALAKRSPATIAKSPPDQSAMKVEAYGALFDKAEPVI